MNLFFKINLILVLTMVAGCNSTKETTNNSKIEDNSREMVSEQKVPEGYTVGTIKMIKDSSCPVIIEMDGSKEQLDPINIDEEKFVTYKKADQKIYFKFNRLRMANRCEKANPVKLLDLKSQ